MSKHLYKLPIIQIITGSEFADAACLVEALYAMEDEENSGAAVVSNDNTGSTTSNDATESSSDSVNDEDEEVDDDDDSEDDSSSLTKNFDSNRSKPQEPSSPTRIMNSSTVTVQQAPSTLASGKTDELIIHHI